jgi:peptide subunit release factor 1 (eRF1)
MGKPAEIKTKQTDSSVEDFIAKVANEQKQKDSHTLLKLMEKVSKEKPKMWGATIVGFGSKRYKSPASGREVDWFRIGFSPRKANMTVYLIDMSAHAAALKKLGKHKIGGGCLYINKLEDIDMKVLGEMVQTALKNK